MYLKHHGIDGQKWYQRNGPPYPLNYSDYSPEEKRLNKKDERWAKRNNEKIYKKAYKKSESELEVYVKQLNNQYKLNANGKVSASYINAFNKKMAQVMSDKVSDLESPSGKAVTFVAKRGEIGVYMALADRGYDMSNVKNGVWNSGRIAYRKTQLEKV